MLSPNEVVQIVTPLENRVGSILVTSVSKDGQVIGRLILASKEQAPVAVAAFEAANDAAEAFAFAAMELEESNLAALAVEFRLPSGHIWKLGADVHRLLVTDGCRHIAFRVRGHL